MRRAQTMGAEAQPRQRSQHEEQLAAKDRSDLGKLGPYEQVVNTFKKYDFDRNANMSFKEMHRLMFDLNQGEWTQNESDKLFTKIDKNMNGAVDVDEFVNYIFAKNDAMGGGGGSSDYEKVMDAFRKFDVNKNGTLDKREFTRIMSSIKEGQWQPKQTDDIFAAVDKDRSGEVDLDELVAYLFGVPKNRQTQAKRAAKGKEHGPMVVIEIVCGKGPAPSSVVQTMANTWSKQFGRDVAVLKKVDKDISLISKISARDGEVVFWETATMIAHREDPFKNPESSRDFMNEMSRRHIPRLIGGCQ